MGFVKHNALCPVCQDRWKFDERLAHLTSEEREDLKQHNHLLVVCEDCESKEKEIEEAYQNHSNRIITFAY